MSVPTVRAEDAPGWFHHLGVASWICTADHRITHANPAAIDLLGAAVGKECHEVVRGRDAEGRPLCRVDCPVRDCIEEGRPVEPVRACVGAAERWVDLVTLPLGGPREAAPLVHLAVAVPGDPEPRAYLERVASRYRPLDRVPRIEQCDLTPREHDILQRLARDKDPQTIARELDLSPATVRNHVQRLLSKVGVHSIQEAVAVLLLDAGRARSSGSGEERPSPRNEPGRGPPRS